MKKDTTKQGQKPFFARLLEQQELEQVVGGGVQPDKTTKYPSDSDEGTATVVFPPRGDVTQKFPSDNDETDL
jgi:hypothetical protein